MIIRRKATVKHDEELVKKARIKQARVNTEDGFKVAAKLFTDSALRIRQIMKELGSDQYENFKAGFDECALLRMDPLFIGSQRAQYEFGNLQGADAWLKHEADKLGEAYVSPAHFYRAWELAENNEL